MTWALVALIASATTAGDVLQSRGMKRLGEVHDFRPRSLAGVIRRMVRAPLLLCGVGALAVAFFAQLALLSMADLSFAVPATASSYVMETILARHILREQVTWRRWAGAGLTACGVALLSL